MIVMEYMKGRCLYNILSEQAGISLNCPILKEQQIFTIMVKMLKCIRLLHVCDIIHADIKIDNWLYDQKDQNLYLIDFGKSIDNQLFIRSEEDELRYSHKYLNPVSPHPSCSPYFVFQCDLNGLAGCLFSLITSKIMKQGDISVKDGQFVINLNFRKYYQFPAVMEVIFNKLLNCTFEGKYG